VTTTVSITEYEGPCRWERTTSGNEPSLAVQSVTVTGSSGQSAAFQNNTGLIVINAPAATIAFAIGPNPTATAASSRMAAGETRSVTVPQGQGTNNMKIAVITPAAT
jgi:hypothetical protein